MSLDPHKSVLVLLDCEEGVAAGQLPDPGVRKAFANSLTKLIGVATSAGVPIIRVDVAFRPGHPEVAPTNAYFSAVKANGRLVEGTDATRPMAELSDLVEDTTRVVKKRIGGFAGSDLEQVLRGDGRTHLVLAGLITRGAILSTATQGADLDYEITVVADGCFDPDPEVHRILMESVLPIRGTVATTADLMAGADR